MNPMNVLIRSARIFSPGSPFHGQTKDLLINSGTIIAVQPVSDQRPADTEIIEGTDLCVSPGWFDLHVNFCEPGFEQREDLQSGSRAAAQGGFTGVLLMPSTKPAMDTKSTIEFVRKRTEGGLVEVWPAGCITVGREGKDLAELYDMFLSGAPAFTDDQHALRNAGVMLRALHYVKDFGGKLMVYCDDTDLSNNGQMNEGPTSTMLGLKGIPTLAESVMVARDLQLLEYSGGSLHLSTISTGESVKLIRAAKQKGLRVTADVAAYLLALSDEELTGFDTHAKVKPPLRAAEDRDALIAGLLDGTLDAISTDHRPLDVESKEKEFDLAEFGMIGLETAFGALNTVLQGKVSTDKLVEALAVNPRKILGLPVPVVQEGAAANLTVFSTSQTWQVTTKSFRSKSANSPFIGRTLTGKPIAVIHNNQYVRIP